MYVAIIKMKTNVNRYLRLDKIASKKTFFANKTNLNMLEEKKLSKNQRTIRSSAKKFLLLINDRLLRNFLVHLNFYYFQYKQY